MITDIIEHASLYYHLSPGIRVALQYLSQTDLVSAEPGRYDFHAGCYAMVQDYESKPADNKRYEAHRRYIDVQFVVSGKEQIGYADYSALRSVEPFSEEKDVEWFEGDGSFIRAAAGTFVVLFPHDAHKPGVALDGPGPVRKVVVKVPAERQ